MTFKYVVIDLKKIQIYIFPLFQDLSRVLHIDKQYFIIKTSTKELIAAHDFEVFGVPGIILQNLHWNNHTYLERKLAYAISLLAQ